MCGIAGWVTKDKGILGQEAIVKAMTDTMAKRGPDSYGIWKGHNTILGHRRLTVVDPEGGGQPMEKKIGDRNFVLVYNGELYNTEQLRQELIEKGYSFRSYSDTEVLLTSYIEWNTECVNKFNGIYAFGLWDEHNKYLFMARDPLGVKPLFYIHREDSIIFASEIKALLAHPDIEPQVDKEGIMEIVGLGPARSSGCGVFKDIEEIPPAHCISFGRNGFKMWEYWKLNSLPHTQSLGDTVENVRHLVIDAIQRQLISDVPVCTFLSGGLDSSAISAVAAKAFQREGKGKLDTYSIDYQDNHKYFTPNQFQPNSDGEWAAKMSQYIGSNHSNIVISTKDLVAHLREAVKASDLPGMADIDSSLYLFAKEVRKHATVGLSGECADEIFGGYPWYWRTEDVNYNGFPWSKAIEQRSLILSKEFSSLPLQEYVQSKYNQTIDKVERLDGESSSEYRMRQLFYLNIKWFMVTLLNRKDRMTMANSLEVRVPFADYRIVEYAYNIPWEMKYCDNREKGLLRRALRGILPDEIIDRKKSPYPKTHNPLYLKAVSQWLGEIVGDNSSPLLQIIDRDRVKEIVDSRGVSFSKPWFGQLMTGPQLMAYLIQIDLWMREYKVKLV